MARTARNTRTASAELSRRILVQIDRGMTDKPTRVVWQHEKVLLDALHGDGKVIELEGSVLDDGYTPKTSAALLPYNKLQDTPMRPSEAAGIGFVFVGDPSTEFARLSEVYGRMPDENIVVAEKVFGRFSDGRFESMLGVPTFEDLPEAQLRQLLDEFGVAPSAPLPTMSDSEKDEHTAARKAFLAADKATLIAMCEQGGVTIG